MRKKEFVNNFKLFFLSSCLSICYWLICNNELTYLSPSYELYRQVNASIYGYSSMQSYFLIYLVPFVILLYILMSKERDYYIIRFNSRRKIVLNRKIELIRAVGIIFIPHFVINIIGITSFFKFNNLCQLNYYFYELLQFIIVILLFYMIGLIYMYLSDYIKKEISNFVIPLGFIAYYYFNRIFIHYAFMRELCVKDLLIINSISNIEIIIGILKYLLVIFIFVKMMNLKIKEKDIYEK